MTTKPIKKNQDNLQISQISQLIRPELANIQAYSVPDSTGFVKLDAMENPYSLPKNILAKISKSIKTINFNRYPDANCSELKLALVKAELVLANMPIVLGNGSDELISLIHQLIPPKSTVFSFAPSFSMYELNATINAHNFIKIPLNTDFSLPLQHTLQALVQHKPALMWISYPNNPTGNLFNFQDLITIIEANPGFTVIDEAYLPFVTDSKKPTMLEYIKKYKKLIILRTLSKVGLAGLRIGYMVGDKQVIDNIEKIRLPYNIDRLSAEITKSILTCYYYALIKQTEKISEEREKQYAYFKKRFAKYNLQVFSSQTNFLLIRLRDSQLLYQFLLQRKIMIKNLHNVGGLLENCLRITIGSKQENILVRRAMQDFLVK